MSKNYLSKQKIPFTMVCNQIILDVRISSKAKFYYVYLSSKPEGWEFHTNAIIKEIKEGKDAFYTGLQELEEFGYLERTQKRVGGKFSATEYMLLIPSNLSHTENPDTEKSDTENPDHNNIYSNKKDLNKKDCNARQSNFSKNSEGGGQNIPTLENSSIPNKSENSPIAKNATTESYEPRSITEEEYITEWEKINDRTEPAIGFKKSLENFLRCCNINVQKEHGGWKNYLASEWIPKEKFLQDRGKGKKPEISEHFEYKPPALTTLTTDLRNKPETFQELNEKFHEALKEKFPSKQDYGILSNIKIIGFDEKKPILLIDSDKKRKFIYEFYSNRFVGSIKQACKMKNREYELLLEEELKTTNN